jgi:hypothetical protein
MQSAEEILQEKLSKRVLSNKTTREGLLSCMVVTVMRYLSAQGRPEAEEAIRNPIYDEAYEAFRDIGSDFEFPNLDDLKKVKERVEKKSLLEEIRVKDPGRFTEYDRTCQTLFEKYDG